MDGLGAIDGIAFEKLAFVLLCSGKSIRELETHALFPFGVLQRVVVWVESLIFRKTFVDKVRRNHDGSMRKSTNELLRPEYSRGS